jgi:predicted ribosome quality control (RQC) complex YloA/Tae2 family protein
LDNVVLTRVAAALDASLGGAALEVVLAEPPRRIRLVFVREGRPRTALISLDPRLPWVARPSDRERARGGPCGVFAAACMRRVRGHVLEALSKPSGADRRVEFRFAGGSRIVAEVATPSPVAVLLDPEGRVVAHEGGGKAARARLSPGTPYEPRPVAGDRVDPFAVDSVSIQRRIEAEAAAGGGTWPEAIRRTLAGVSAAVAEAIWEDSVHSGGGIGGAIERRMLEVRTGRVDPVIEAPWDPIEAARSGTFDLARCRLLPWEPATPCPPGSSRLREADAAQTAGIYHEAAERASWLARRSDQIAALVEAERRRLRGALARAAEDRERFAEPDLWRRRGEALLAALGRAVRDGESVLVEDPYDPTGPRIEIPCAPGKSLAEVAEECFRSHRRARRGLAQAEERASLLAQRLALVESILAGSRGRSEDWLSEIEASMREAGIPVALERSAGQRRAARRSGVRLEGVRVFRTVDGWTALAGKTAKDNARLTFKLAGPEDFWFHAAGCAGAHVVLRNDERRSSPPRATLEEAAGAAAWYSDQSRAAHVDVHWTRCKYVRKVRGAAPGTVRLKRFEIVRVRPRQPQDSRGAG